MRGRRYSWGTVEGKARLACVESSRELSLRACVKQEVGSSPEFLEATRGGPRGATARYSQREDP